MSQKTFRTALNGFNREDVVRYIEYLNAQHIAEINRLNSELEYLRKPAAQPAPSAPVVVSDDAQLQQQASRIRELFDQCKEKDEKIAALTAEVARLQHTSIKSSMEEELEIYRRAERAERLAQERVDQMYQQANAIIADATIRVDDAAALISQMSDKVFGELGALQDAVSGSKQALKDAASTMYTIRPGTEAE